MCHCGVTRRSGHGDRTLRLVLPATEQLSCDQTLASVWSALTEHVRLQKLLSETLLMLTGRRNLESGHSLLSVRPVTGT